MEDSQRLTLVSASPRRLDLLSLLVPNFALGRSTVEESGLTELPDRKLSPIALSPPFWVPHGDDPRLWAWRKALDFVDQNGSLGPEHLILSADTVVVARTEILGKPRDYLEAMRMLQLLAGASHFVVTGFCLLAIHDGEMREVALQAVHAEVQMRRASDAEREAYIATGEPFDKAGAYALQGLGGKLVTSVIGCHSTVIGLPVCATREALLVAGADLHPRPIEGYCPACPQLLT